MSEPLKAKQVVPLTQEELEAIQFDAASRDVTTGLYCRALLLYAFERVDTASVRRRIEEEYRASQVRIGEGARTAARTRWGKSGEVQQ